MGAAGASSDRTPQGARPDTAGSALTWPRLLRFGVVGGSGVLVNLASLWALVEVLHLPRTLGSAGAIAISIGSNFVLNDRWTFADRRSSSGDPGARAVRFYAVSLVGAILQWGVFVLLQGATFAGATGRAWLYTSQLGGIAAAAGWNFLVNVAWTWRTRGAGGDRP